MKYFDNRIIYNRINHFTHTPKNNYLKLFVRNKFNPIAIIYVLVFLLVGHFSLGVVVVWSLGRFKINCTPGKIQLSS